MKLDALRLGLATAIVTAIVWLVSRGLFLATMPAHPVWAGRYMMRGGGPMTWGSRPHLFMFGWAGLLIGLVLWPLVAGLAAAATAAIYNWLMRRDDAKSSRPSD